MEQRIGSNTKPLTPPAAVDPALIPGLTVPVTADGAPEDAAVPDAASDEADAVVEDAAPEPEGAAGAAAAGGADDSGEAAEDLGEGASAPAPVPDGPVLEAKDFRARLVADHAGIRLCLDDQECEFRWDEIAAVETSTSRFGKRYTVVVHTPERRWYWIEIDAKSRADVARWETELDAVLDVYFEEAAGEAADADGAADAEDDAKPAGDADAEADPKAAAKADAETDGDGGRKPGAAQA
ncbi:hypothetical protein [Streptomyces fragilis]|uniref:Uncharacterized protein n=1 Tax=Streptomyces fragilis TaxID=67301 RepID=A0ABV2YEL3_9ACTN|nr:hypothetical protein [Streptomyces fragilis]